MLLEHPEHLGRTPRISCSNTNEYFVRPPVARSGRHLRCPTVQRAVAMGRNSGANPESAFWCEHLEDVRWCERPNTLYNYEYKYIPPE